jgi:hypothetical protein
MKYRAWSCVHLRNIESWCISYSVNYEFVIRPHKKKKCACELETVQSCVINVPMDFILIHFSFLGTWVSRRCGAWNVVWKTQGNRGLIPGRWKVIYTHILPMNLELLSRQKRCWSYKSTHLIVMSRIRMSSETLAHHSQSVTARIEQLSHSCTFQI